VRFENVYFITGTAYAGKSTMVHLLAEKHSGIECEENYHNRLLPGLGKEEFPALTWSRDLEDWHEFIRRTPETYEAWMDQVSRECETLELRLLPEAAAQGRPVFVDSNISLETLRKVAAPGHVLIIADLYLPWEDVPEGCETRIIPASLWAQFPCTIRTLQDTNTKIWSEWLPALQGYTLAGEYDIEVYLPPEEGSDDMKVYIWVPLKQA